MDSIVTSIINKFKQRSEFGQQKYGTNLDRKDLSFLDWTTHMQEELMDAILYLEKMKKEYLGNQCPCHREKNLPGWCGVAGGGVPACDH